jgi:hypothetical protein
MKYTCHAALLLVSLFASSCSSEEVQIRAIKKHTIRSLLSPHVDPSITLIVGTNRIHDVIGRPPYYIKIPQWDSVFVATETREHRFYYHIVNLKNQPDMVIDGKSTSFGYWIGARNGVSQEYVSKVENGQLTLSARTAKRRINYVIDLTAKRAISMEIEDLTPKEKF